MRYARCYLAELLIGLALKISPKDYLPSVVEAAQMEGQRAYEDEYRNQFAKQQA